jgi:hypothetical protein
MEIGYENFMQEERNICKKWPQNSTFEFWICIGTQYHKQCGRITMLPSTAYQLWCCAHIKLNGRHGMGTTESISGDIWEHYSDSTDDCHAFYLFQEILRTIIGCVDNAHTKYEADSLDWQSIIDDGNELLCKADMLQFKELHNNNYMLCKEEYHLYKEWTQVTEARPRYVSIMNGRITDKVKQAWNKDYNQFDDFSDNDRREAFFLAHHQMLAHHQWLSYCPEEATLFWNFKVSKPVCTASINEK